ncbi:MAG: molybdate ABC transporter ATP-binding protein ModF [Desulfuromonadales bacterium]|nr:molybdate ABC transporter ATP-binding protein ModF [Desulfuromonadales bacterium]
MSRIALHNVSARLNSKSFLQDISLQIRTGEHWAIIGANGCGKSSLGRLLCGDLEIVAGDARLPARSEYVSFEKVTELLEHEKKLDDSDFIGCFDPGTTARQFLCGNRPVDLEKLDQLSTKMNFGAILGQGLKTLSTGEMRKVVICRALLRDPELLVLDEPFDGLDYDSCLALQEIISSCLNDGITVVLVLNRFDEILPEVTHIAYLKDCSLFVAGPKKEILGSGALLRFHSFHYTLPPRLPGEDVRLVSVAGSDETPLIEMKSVTVRYGDHTVLNGLDWTVNRGEHWTIAGPNGSGKTTLLNLINGDNVQGYGSDVWLFGRKKGSGESVWDIRQRLGYVSTTLQQNYRVGVTAKVAIISGFFDSIGVYRKYSRQQETIALEWLELLHMEKQRNVPFRSLSYGEQRMLLIARAMVKFPELLILDEPCQGLDDANREMVLKLVDHLGSIGKTQIFYVSHRQADRIPCISKTLRLVPAEGGGSKALVEVG